MPETRPARINARTRQEFARLISVEMQNAIRSFISVGRLLIEAKAELVHGEYLKMLHEDLRFRDVGKAERFMAIARHPIIGNSAHAPNLPPAWYTLYLMTTLPDATLKQMISNGLIHHGIERKDVEQIIKNLREASRRGNLYKLLTSLETVKAAISENPIIPTFTHFWFTGDRLMAYNDQIALSVPFPADFKGTVPSTLLPLLKLAHFDHDIEVKSKTGKLVIREAKNGRVRIKLEMCPPEFLFTMPEPVSHHSYRSDGLVKAVEHCLISLGTDTSVVEHLGVTIKPSENRLYLYSADGRTMSRAETAMEGWSSGRVILPAAFCRQMVALAKRQPQHHSSLQMREQEPAPYALFRVGDTVLYGRLLQTRSPLNFTRIIGGSVSTMI